jgi:Rab GDP dissociation inhibitor
MGCGNLVKMLLHTKVTRYLEFRCLDGSFVYKDAKLYEVPITPQAALNSALMGIFQKRRYKNFLQWVLKIKVDDPKTWSDGKTSLDLTKLNMKQVFDYWKCDDNTQDFTGHAVALHVDDAYLDDPSQTLVTLERLQLYAFSLNRFEKSPYIYPVWGLGGLPEGFSRLAAVHGGVYMLRRQVKKILYNDDGTVKGVEAWTEGKREGEAYCKQLIADPSYFVDTDKVKKTGQVARWMCIMDHPVEGTNNAGSAQIILPHKQTGHKSDIYISVLSDTLQVAPKGRWVAMISAQVYTDSPKKELRPAAKMLGKVLKDFFFVVDQYDPTDDGSKDNIFISSSMDATSHFQRDTRDVMRLYQAVTGKEVDLNRNPEDIGSDAQYE